MSVNFNNVPNELKGLKQWIMWKYEVKEGKKTKVPYQTNDMKASVTNPNHWGMLSDVEDAMNSGLFEGVGFVFTDTDGFTGVDIDGSVDGKDFDTKTVFIMHNLASYTELSPSEAGIHIIVKGKVPAGYKNKNTKDKIECYEKGRFFTFTGNQIGGYKLAERTEELKTFASKYLPKREVIEYSKQDSSTPETISNMSNADLWNKMFNSKNGDRIKSLYAGNVENDDPSSTDLALCNFLAFWTNNDPKRMDAMFCESSLYREKWEQKRGANTYGEMTIQKAINGTKSTIADSLTRKVETVRELDVAEEVSDEIKEEKTGTPSFRLTELGNAERVKYHHGDNMIFNDGIGWMIWNGKKWKPDETAEVSKIISKTLRDIEKEAVGAEEDDAKKILKWANICEKRSTRNHCYDDLTDLLKVSEDDFNKNNMLFNCENGVYDLENNVFLEHDRKYKITNMSPVVYDEDAVCPTWEKFLETTFVDEEGKTDYELMEYIQKAIGYTLTGKTNEQAMFFFYGEGSNGKSVFTGLINDLLGDYGRRTAPETFTKSKGEGINNDVARLHGCRYVSTAETESSQVLSEGLVKQITGGEKMTARFLRKEFFEFMPEFKVFFATNHKPIIKGTDHGIWRRVKLIHFLAKITDENRDPLLADKLKLELPGIFNWAVEGCMKWQKEGLKEPQSVLDATSNYREDMDKVSPFLKQYCDEDANSKIEAVTLFKAYKKWCFENEDEALNNRTFYRDLETRGFKKVSGAKNKNFIVGISLKEGVMLYN